MKTLILLTNYYPYYKGEEYLESEIEYLSEEFDQIYLFSTLINKNMKRTRTVPKNVEVYPVYYENTLLTKLSDMLAIGSVNKSMRGIIEHDAGKNLINYLYDSYFENRTNRVFKQIVQHLEASDVNKAGPLVIYSYWMHATAKVAVELKQRYFKERVKFIFSRAHRYDVDVNASPINFLPLRSYLLEHLDKVYCVSNNNKEYLHRYYPSYKRKVEVRHLGTRKYSDSNVAKQKPFVIVSCSLLRKVKRIDRIVMALKELEDRYNVSVKWVHFGNGPEYETIVKMAKEKLKITTVELPGYKKNSEVIDYYNNERPSLFINVSESEGVPVSIMEAMSFGIPAVATDVGGNNEIVKSQFNGILLPEKVSPSLIATSIYDIMKMTSQEYKQTSDNAYSMWYESFYSDKNYAEFTKEIMKHTNE